MKSEDVKVPIHYSLFTFTSYFLLPTRPPTASLCSAPPPPGGGLRGAPRKGSPLGGAVERSETEGGTTAPLISAFPPLPALRATSPSRGRLEKGAPQKGMQDREAAGFERAFSAHASRKIAEIHASIPAIFHFT